MRTPSPYADPSGPVDFPRLVRMAALLGIPVVRWDGRRYSYYAGGREIPAPELRASSR